MAVILLIIALLLVAFKAAGVNPGRVDLGWAGLAFMIASFLVGPASRLF